MNIQEFYSRIALDHPESEIAEEAGQELQIRDQQLLE